MSGDLDLFGNPVDDHAEDAMQAAEATPELAARWQVDLLRKALDSRDLTTMDARREAIAGVVGRPVESLQALTQVEALEALRKLGDTAPTSRSGGSAWDDREEDTWIDRL